MSLNCMNCHLLNRTHSNTDMNTKFLNKPEKPKHRFEDHSKVHENLRSRVLSERNWSGSLIPPTYNNMDESMECGTPKKKAKRVHHRRFGSTGSELRSQEDDFDREPKLVRSGGIRRDWSFEDLDAPKKRDGKRKQRT